MYFAAETQLTYKIFGLKRGAYEIVRKFNIFNGIKSEMFYEIRIFMREDFVTLLFFIYTSYK